MSRTIGVRRSRHFRRKPLRRTLAEIGHIVTDIASGIRSGALTTPEVANAKNSLVSRTTGLGRSRRVRRKPLRRTLTGIGLIAAGVSFGVLLVVLAIMGLLQSTR